MKNTTINPPKNESRRDVEIFGEISPDVFQAILDIIPVICRAVLNWEPLASSFLVEIIRQIPLSGDLLHLKHSEFGRVLWGEDVSEAAIRRRLGRAIKSVKRCQLLSGFNAVRIDSGDVIEIAGKIEYFPTTYQLRDFFFVFIEIRDLAKEQDLMSLQQRQRKITLYAIAKSICDARGYVEIPKRERKEKDEREESEKKKTSPLLCKCDCASCVHCASKSANVSEAGGAARIRKLARQPNEVYHTWLEGVTEEFYQWLCETGEVSNEFRFRVKSQMQAFEVEVNRAREMIVRSSAR